MMFDFEGQTAIVTGGTRGIGQGVSEALLQAGARVVATYSANEAAAEAFLKDNAAHGDRVEARQFDVADIEAVEQFFEEFDRRVGAPQILVNNAGIRRDAIVGLMSEEEWRSVIEANLTGAFHMCKHAVRLMSGERYGRIINVVSPSGKHGFEGQANYAASKAGLVALSKSLAREVARRNVTVNCVSPGFIDTDLIGDLPEELLKRYKGEIPMRRFGKVEEVAPCVLFLASREASYVTGATLEVTGGV